MPPPLPPPITSRTNARVKELRASLSGQARRPGDLLGLEGPNLIQEATYAGLQLETIFLRQGGEDKVAVQWRGEPQARQWLVLSPEVFDSAVSTANPQGVAATWRIVEPKLAAREAFILILENIQDPGNLGTLIRSAAAFGFREILVTPDTANHWNPKVVRAAAGALFSTPVRRMPIEAIVTELHGRDIRIFAAVASFLNSPEEGFVDMVAHHGVLTGRLSGPAAPAPYGREATFGDAPPEARYTASTVVDTDFEEPCAIMIGNEGAGLTTRARRLADEQVSIPCGVESLNAAIAGSVLMYEAMRQRGLRQWARQQGLRP